MCRINSAVNFSAQHWWLQTVPVVYEMAVGVQARFFTCKFA